MSKIVRAVDELYDGLPQWEIENDDGKRAYMTFQEMILERVGLANWNEAMDEVEATLSDRVRACPHCAGEECSH
jgi:hypothetical protein